MKKEETNTGFYLLILMFGLVIGAFFALLFPDTKITEDITNQSYVSGWNNGTIYTLGMLNQNFLNQLEQSQRYTGTPYATIDIFTANNQTFKLICVPEQ